ncbi:Hypothetical protein BN69_3091 [Methylocystis sp. SC2]|nr:Hypothetical protein BN69_3091 [Methylocystis sp. SC2]
MMTATSKSLKLSWMQATLNPTNNIGINSENLSMIFLGLKRHFLYCYGK